jgi:glycosyltransferase involved in cell wall biosynthesis
VPAYNAAQFLPAALDSLLAQTHPAWEAIIVDDGSSDETPQIAASYAKRDSRFRLITQPNAGVGAARNRGIQEARGEFIAPLDADDIWQPTKLERQIENLENCGPEWGFCYCWSFSIDEEGHFSYPLKNWPLEGRVFHSLIYRNIIGNASVPLIRTAAFREVGGYRTRDQQKGAQGCEDWELTLRLAEKYLVTEVPDYLVGYRATHRSMSGNTARMARSYEYSVATLLRRNPTIPASLLRWSAGHYYLYLLNIAYNNGHNRECIGLLKKTIQHDPMTLLTPTIYRIGPMAFFRMFFGRRFLRRSHQNDASCMNNPSGLQRWIWKLAHATEDRRWRLIRNREM